MQQDRQVLRIGGADAREFLQGLITNDIAKLDQGLVYAAMLTPQGKYLADFFLIEKDKTILLDVAAPLAAGLMQRLSMYRLRADVTIETSDLKPYCGTGPCPDNALPDPRDPSMGWRRYGEMGGQDDSDWDNLRVMACVPESGIELTPDTFILEAGFERLNGVDFRKGCYVGQEVTARMKHKTELRKGLATVRVSHDVPVGTPILSDGKPAGVLYTQSHGSGIAYLRFDRTGGNLQAAEATVTLPA